MQTRTRKRQLQQVEKRLQEVDQVLSACKARQLDPLRLLKSAIRQHDQEKER